MFAADASADPATELCELLVAGGYFRARITGLSAFDKVAGGLAWGIQSSREAIDVEFVEDANIGHKIKIGENIEAALHKMDCPFPLAAHQIQGLDYPQIFPVAQWLLKRVISTREETARSLRLYADLCFKRSLPDFAAQWGCRPAEPPAPELPPRRVYRRRAVGGHFPTAEEHIRSVLLEYGQKSRLLAEVAADEHEADPAERERLQQSEEAELDRLLGRLGTYKAGQRVAGRDVSAAIARDQESIERYTQLFREKEERLRREREAEEAARNASSRLQARAEELQQEVDAQAAALERAQQLRAEAAAALEATEKALQKAQRRNARIVAEIERVGGALDPVRQAALQALERLVKRNEALDEEKAALVKRCKQTLQQWRAKVEQAKAEQAQPENEHYAQLERQYAEEKRKLQRVLAAVAERNRDIDVLQRQIDAIPTRAELVQYERRFMELYDQVQRKFAETKQYFVKYNTLNETVGYLKKEMDLLDSIHEKCGQVLGTRTAEQLPASIEQTVDSVAASKRRILDKAEAERRATQLLSDACAQLVAKQRAYFTAVKELKEEGDRNEQLKERLEKARAKATG